MASKQVRGLSGRRPRYCFLFMNPESGRVFEARIFLRSAAFWDDVGWEFSI